MESKEGDDNDHDEITENLRLACSVGTFRSTNIESYRDGILKSLQQMVRVANITQDAKSETNNKIENIAGDDEHHIDDDDDDDDDLYVMAYECYDSNQIDRSLSSIEWKDLCDHHDEQTSRALLLLCSNNNKKQGKQQMNPMILSSSPLEEVLAAIVNPTIIPRCCATSVIQTLVQAFLQAPRARHRQHRQQTKDVRSPTTSSRWTHAQSTLLQRISSLYAECPSAGFQSMQHFVPSSSLSEDELLPDSDDGGNFNTALSSLNEWNRLISLTHTLAKDIPRAHFGLSSILLDLIRHMDRREQSILLRRDNTSRGATIMNKRKKSYCPQCMERNASSHDNNDARPGRIKSRRMKCATLENLHDQDLTVQSEEEDNNKNNNNDNKTTFCRTWRLNQWQEDVSLKAVLKRDRKRRRPSTTTSCSYCGNNDEEIQKDSSSSSSSSSVLPPEWNLVRSRAYKKFLNVFEFHHHGVMAVPLSSSNNNNTNSNNNRLQMEQSTQLLNRRRRFDTSILLQLAHVHGAASPCIRACILTCLDRMGGEYPFHHVSLVKTIWDRYLCSSGDDPFWLRISSEFIVESPVFDERTLCWQRFRPVLKRLFLLDNNHNTNESNNDDSDDKEGEEAQTADDDNNSSIVRDNDDDDDKLKWLFRCVAYILSRRFRLFQEKEDDIRSEFESYLSQLKIRFGESTYWVDDDTDLGERERTFKTLEKAGILGLVDLAGDDDDDNDGNQAGEYSFEDPSDDDDHENENGDHGSKQKTIQIQELATKSWPFHSPFDLRSCVQRIGNAECSPRLSALDHDMKVAIEKEEEEDEPNSKPQGPSMLQCVENEDVFRLIFSFFGYKRLVHLREVCSLWKTIVDESNVLWYEAYRARFGFLPDDPRSIWGQQGNGKKGEENWKKLFQSEWRVAQSIAFQRNSTGWKYRICGYVGCHQVLRSANSAQRHSELHDRKRRAELAKAEPSSSSVPKNTTTPPKRSRKRGRTKPQQRQEQMEPDSSCGNVAVKKSRNQSIGQHAQS